MKGIPAIWFGLMLLALLTALTFWIDKAAQPLAPKRDGSTRHDADYIVTNFSTLRTNGFGNPRYKLEGVEMRHFPDDDSTELTKPLFSLYALKNPTTKIIADRGRVSANGENVYFMDNVKVVRAATPRKAEMTVLTDYLHIVPNQDLAQTDRPVIILQAPRTVIHATGMQFYKKQGIVNLQHHVKVHYERPNAPDTKALTIEQVAGSQERLMPGKSVVQPRLDSLVVPRPMVPQPKAPAVKAVKPATLAPAGVNLAKPNKVELAAPLQKAQNVEKQKGEKEAPIKQAKGKQATPASAAKAEKPKVTVKKKPKAKKVKTTQAGQQAKSDKAKSSKVKQSKTRIRRHYENP